MDFLYRAVQMGASLHMHIHHHGPEFSRLLNVVFGVNNHEMYVKGFLTLLGDSLQHGEAKRDIRDEDTVHHIQVQPVSLAAVNHVQFAVQMQEVSSKQGRRNYCSHYSRFS